MNWSVIIIAVAAVVMLALQAYLTNLQYKNYQEAVNSLKGNGWILGIGLRKGGMSLKGGTIAILAWDQKTDCIKACKVLQGPTIWKRFENIDRYCGMTLNEIRRCGVEEDYRLNRRARDKHPYSPLMEDKRRKKGALIQAVEAIDRYLAKQFKQAEAKAGKPKPAAGIIDHQEIRRRAEARQQAIRQAASEGEHQDAAEHKQ